MPRRINEIHLNALPGHAHGSQLDSDAALALQLQHIEVLLLELTLLERPGDFHHAVAQSRLTVINMSDDAEISNFHAAPY